MGDLAGHQETKRPLEIGIVGDVDETLVDDLGARFGGDVGAEIAGRIADRIDLLPWNEFKSETNRREGRPCSRSGLLHSGNRPSRLWFRTAANIAMRNKHPIAGLSVFSHRK